MKMFFLGGLNLFFSSQINCYKNYDCFFELNLFEVYMIQTPK